MLVHNLPQWHCVSFQKQFAPSLYGIWRSRINSALCVEVLLWPDMAIPPTEPSSNITIYCTAILRIPSLLVNNDFTCFTAVQSHHKYFTATSLHWDDEQFVYTYLCAHNFPIGTVASVAVFVPFDSIKGDVSINGARSSCHCVKSNRSFRNITEVMFVMWDFCPFII